PISRDCSSPRATIETESFSLRSRQSFCACGSSRAGSLWKQRHFRRYDSPAKNHTPLRRKVLWLNLIFAKRECSCCAQARDWQGLQGEKPVPGFGTEPFLRRGRSGGSGKRSQSSREAFLPQGRASAAPR